MFGISFSLSRAPDKGPPLVGGGGGGIFHKQLSYTIARPVQFIAVNIGPLIFAAVP
jgi:hypothetical protein